MQLEEECKNMVNNIAVFKFKSENKELELNLDTPNFSNFVKEIIINNYEISESNMDVVLKNNNCDEIDVNELKNIVIEIHQQYKNEISKFYENTKDEISTYYSDDTELVNEIKKYIEEVSNEEK